MKYRTALALLGIVCTHGVWAEEVALTVEEPAGVARTAWPVTSGVPIHQGQLQDPQSTALFDAEGAQVPLQTEVLSRWPDGSVWQHPPSPKAWQAVIFNCQPGKNCSG